LNNKKPFNGCRRFSYRFCDLEVWSYGMVSGTQEICVDVQYQKVLIYLCFFIYSCRAFPNSSLIFRVEPVLFTTNFIHSVHVCLSIFMDVLVFSLPSSTSFTIPYTVNKVNDYYRKLNITLRGIVVWRYCGISSLWVASNSSQDDQEEP
jgi:hypothetical protein